MYWLLFYDVVEDYVERRAPYRAEHLALATEAFARGTLVMAGALADPADGAVLIFSGDTSASPRRSPERTPMWRTGS